MRKIKETNNRRDFLKKCGLLSVPFFLPAIHSNASSAVDNEEQKSDKKKASVNFIYDGLILPPQEYIQKLFEINKANPIEPDFYGNGGATKSLEEEFAKITGKEKAIYFPTGTMANQIAMRLLNANNTKVIVPENSHIFRDEGDAAQSIHSKRLIPVGKDKAYFELSDLENTIDYLDKSEVFKSGLGTIVIENPVRRADGKVVPIETIEEISNYCKQHGYKMHLDGARLHLASAYTKVPIIKYASYFDTVYISLYKYLNTTGGAILCGDAKLIDQISHYIKILGGTSYQSWINTAVAMHYLDGISERLDSVVSIADQLIADLNKIDGLNLNSLKGGTNIYHLQLDRNINPHKLSEFLFNEDNIIVRINQDGYMRFALNESLLQKDYQEIVNAWINGIKYARA